MTQMHNNREHVSETFHKLWILYKCQDFWCRVNFWFLKYTWSWKSGNSTGHAEPVPEQSDSVLLSIRELMPTAQNHLSRLQINELWWAHCLLHLVWDETKAKSSKLDHLNKGVRDHPKGKTQCCSPVLDLSVWWCPNSSTRSVWLNSVKMSFGICHELKSLGQRDKGDGGVRDWWCSLLRLVTIWWSHPLFTLTLVPLCKVNNCLQFHTIKQRFLS